MARVSFRELRNRLERLSTGIEPLPIVTYKFKDGHEEKHRESTLFLLEHKGEIENINPLPLDNFFDALGAETIAELWKLN